MKIRSVLFLFFTLYTFWIIWGYANAELYYDEAYTIHEYISRGWERITTYYDEPNNHVFFNVLSYVWFKIFGIRSVVDNTNVMRALPFLLTAGSFAALFSLTRMVKGSTGAIISVILLASCIPYFSYSLRLRGYILAAVLQLLFLSSFLKYLRSLDQPRINHAHGVLASILAALQLYTLPTMAAPLLAEGLFTLVWCSRKFLRGNGTDRFRWIGPPVFLAMGALLALALYAPMLEDLLRVYMGGDYGARPAETGEFWLETLPALMTDLPGGPLAAAGISFSIWVGISRPDETTLPVLFVAAGTVGAAILVGMSGWAAPIRSFIPYMPGLAFLFAVAIARITCASESDGRFSWAWALLLAGQVNLLIGFGLPYLYWKEKLGRSEPVARELHPLPYYFVLDSEPLLKYYKERSDKTILLFHSGDAYNLAAAAMRHGIPLSLHIEQDLPAALSKYPHLFFITDEPREFELQSQRCSLEMTPSSQPAMHWIYRAETKCPECFRCFMDRR